MLSVSAFTLVAVYPSFLASFSHVLALWRLSGWVEYLKEFALECVWVIGTDSKSPDGQYIRSWQFAHADASESERELVGFDEETRFPTSFVAVPFGRNQVTLKPKPYR